MPDHWKNEYPFLRTTGFAWVEPILKVIFAALCMVAFGSRSLDYRWKKMSKKEKHHESYLERISQRVQSLTIITTLLLPTIVTLLTADPPSWSLVRYNEPFTQWCLWTAFGLLLGGVIVGVAEMYMLATYTRRWGKEVAMATRFRVWCGLILLSYPFFATFSAILIGTIGLAHASWLSDSGLHAAVGALVVIVLPSSLLLPLGLRSLPVSKAQQRETQCPNQSYVQPRRQADIEAAITNGHSESLRVT
ncbi:hypothetical protein EXIGLDRAFT_838383 [Exidia glandulosa HHB12029]|uniref:Transmembrane protein n=1 Tax=Exidia glandulosa HHB12029 TaxID=1314781 RepID=A0A165FXE8_EXIGL|nr:hypothetical protein EXIGLDRAFT_838383 [Exidia glandulosa HHB12029]